MWPECVGHISSAIATHSILAWTEGSEFFAEVARILKPQGRLYVSTDGWKLKT